MLIQAVGGHPAEINEFVQSFHMQMPESQRTFVGSTTKPLFFTDPAGTQTDMVVAPESLTLH